MIAPQNWFPTFILPSKSNSGRTDLHVPDQKEVLALALFLLSGFTVSALLPPIPNAEAANTWDCFSSHVPCELVLWYCDLPLLSEAWTQAPGFLIRRWTYGALLECKLADFNCTPCWVLQAVFHSISDWPIAVLTNCSGRLERCLLGPFFA